MIIFAVWLLYLDPVCYYWGSSGTWLFKRCFVSNALKRETIPKFKGASLVTVGQKYRLLLMQFPVIIIHVHGNALCHIQPVCMRMWWLCEQKLQRFFNETVYIPYYTYPHLGVCVYPNWISVLGFFICFFFLVLLFLTQMQIIDESKYKL